MKFRLIEGYNAYIIAKQVYDSIYEEAKKAASFYKKYQDTFKSGSKYRMKMRFMFSNQSDRDKILAFAETRLDRKSVERIKSLFKLSKGQSYSGYYYFTLSSPSYSEIKDMPEEGELSPDAEKVRQRDVKSKARREKIAEIQDYNMSVLNYLVEDMKEQLDCLEGYNLDVVKAYKEKDNLMLILTKFLVGLPQNEVPTEEDVIDISTQMDDYLRSNSQFWLDCAESSIGDYNVYVDYVVHPDMKTAYKNYQQSEEDDSLIFDQDM